ncbi:uncharacterized protein LOC135146100 [Zophobas morio]|uniref:uncharacterized protein LOC135146100 n=1 Tax=Zophobas morio TaxID=2755281 RepID=UPI003082C7BB
MELTRICAWAYTDSAGSVSSNNRENFPDKLDIISIITTRSDETENYCVHNLNRKDRKNSTIREVIIPKIDYMYRRPALFSLSKKVKSLPFFEVKQNRKHFFGLKLEWISSRLIVVSIEKGTRAERCGINIGDELLELNGYVITTQLSKRAINNIFNLSQEVKLKIKDGQGKYLTIHKDQYSKKVSLGLRLSKRKVVVVQAGSVAEQVKVSVGETLSCINGRPTVGKSDKNLQKKIQRSLGRRSVTLTLLTDN